MKTAADMDEVLLIDNRAGRGLHHRLYFLAMPNFKSIQSASLILKTVKRIHLQHGMAKGLTTGEDRSQFSGLNFFHHRLSR